MKRFNLRVRRRVIPLVEIVLLALFILLPMVLENFWVVFFTRVLIFGLLAISFDLVWGYVGVLSFGQALFFGAGAYTVAIFTRDLGIDSIFLVLPIAVLVGFALAAFMGWFLLIGPIPPSLIFVALGTLTGSYAAERLALSWYYLGGPNGIPSISAMTVASRPIYEGVEFYYLALGFLTLIYLLCRWLVRSQFGLVLAGLRQQEERITFFGYRAPVFKAGVFAMSGAIAGLGGSLLAFHDGFVWPNLLGVILSTQAVLYVLFGGVGTLIGAIIGVTAIEYLSLELADRFPGVWPVVLGVLLLVVIRFRPTGLVGLLVGERERVGSFGKRHQERETGVGDAAT